jgi:hypothetical protein
MSPAGELLAWIDTHKALHPQASWEDYESENGGLPDAYRPWIHWWRRHRVAVAEARALSLMIKEAPPAQRRDPDNHLYLLGRALKTLREEGGPPADGDAPAAAASYRDPAAASAGCPDCGGASGLALRRLDVAIGGGAARELSVTLGCLCPLGRLQLARERQGSPRAIDLADWPSLWLAGHRHHTWPEEPAPGRRRILGGWHRPGGVEIRILRCTAPEVLLPDLDSRSPF